MNNEIGIPSEFWDEKHSNEDTGHIGLMADLRGLIRDAMNYEFHDYKNKKYSEPKLALAANLEQILSRVKNGWYDNKNTT